MLLENSLYLPEDFDPELSGEKIIPRGGKIPSHPFPLNICLTPEQATKLLSAVEVGAYALYTDEIMEVLKPVLQAFEDITPTDVCGTGQAGTEQEVCNTYAPNSHIITYAPNDPFQTPDFEPSGYPDPPWRAYPFWFDPANVMGYEEGDVVFQFFDSPLDVVDFMLNIGGIGTELISSGFPRFKIRFSGVGTVELHLLKTPMAGLALITLDGNPVGKTIDLNSVSVGDMADSETLLDILTAIGGILISSSLGALKPAQTHIEEIIVQTEGEHYIDVTLIPNLSGNLITWGGGLRKVVLCNQQLVGVPNQMPQFQVNPTTFQMEWKPSELHTQWEPIGQVIYPITMQTDPTNPDLVQYTLQGIPIGGGANPFSQWVNLIELANPILGANATTLNVGEPATATIDGNKILQLGIPQGNTGTNGADAASPELRVSGGFIQWKLETSGTWNNLIAVSSLVGANGINGTNGASPELRVSGGYIQWKLTTENTWHNLIAIADLEGQDCDCTPSIGLNDDPEQTSDERKCAIATGLGEYLTSKFVDVAQDVAATSNAASAIDTLFSIIPPVYLVVDYVMDIVNEVVTVGSSAVLAAMDTDTIEAIQGWLYCNMGNDGLTETVWADFIAAHDELIDVPAVATAWEKFLNGLTFDYVSDRAKIASYGSGNCAGFDCGQTGTWEHVFDYTLGSQPAGATFDNYEGVNPTGDYNANGHLSTCINTVAGGSRMRQRPWFVPVSFFTPTQIEIELHNPSGVNVQMGLAYNHGSGWTQLLSTIIVYSETRDISGMGSTAYVWVDLMSPPYGDGTGNGCQYEVRVKRITLRGTGTNPFI